MQQPPIYPVDYYTHFKDCVRGMRRRFGERPAVTTFTRRGEPETRDYRTLCGDAWACGEALLAMGLGGRHIALVGENSYEWLVAFYGVVSAGCVAVTVDVEQTAAGMQAMLKRADVAAAFCSAGVQQAFCDAGLNPGIPVLGLRGECQAGALPLAALLEQGRESLAAGHNRLEQAPAEPEATALIAFTSGTTSVSKPVMISQRGLCTNASESVAMIQATPKVFSALPLYHTYGLTCSVLGPLIMGAHMGINGDLKTMVRDMALFNAETIMTVPLMSEVLHKRLMAVAAAKGLLPVREEPSVLERAKRALFKEAALTPPAPTPERLACRDEALGGLRVVVTGGAHLSDAIWEDFQAFGVDVQQGYGITECAPLISATRSGIYNPPGSAGWFLPSYEARFEDGEILVRGVCVMQGYYKDPALTEEAFLDGFFRTGDVGYIDSEGVLRITGRKKNLIVLKNGKKIAPEEIELKVGALPMVREVMAYGATSGESTDDVKLAVMIYPEEQETAGMSAYEILDALQREIDRINDEYPTYKQIKMVNLREDAFEKTSSKKIRRQMV